MVVRVTKEFSFDMAHALLGYQGLCKNIHGHTYSLKVTVKGKVHEELKDENFGFVVDFSELKKIVKEVVIDHYDHFLVLHAESPILQEMDVRAFYERVRIVDFQPSCENLLLDILQRLKSDFPKSLSLVKLRLDETPTSFAEWLIEDQL